MKTYPVPLHGDSNLTWLYDVETICQVTLEKNMLIIGLHYKL